MNTPFYRVGDSREIDVENKQTLYQALTFAKKESEIKGMRFIDRMYDPNSEEGYCIIHLSGKEIVISTTCIEVMETRTIERFAKKFGFEILDRG